MSTVQPTPTPTRPSYSDDDDVSFRDLVTAYAASHSVEFLPNIKRGSERGHPIYTFNGLNVYLHEQNVYAFQNGTWNVLSLPELLETSNHKRNNTSTKSKSNSTNSTTYKPKTSQEDVD
jgi:hypothetical protein